MLLLLAALYTSMFSVDITVTSLPHLVYTLQQQEAENGLRCRTH
jgi:hypothetical protein